MKESESWKLFEIEFFSEGIGDSVASIVGSNHGNVKFPDSEKTIEGTASAIVAQVSQLIHPKN